MLNIADHKIRSEFLNLVKKLYKKVGISQIPIKKSYMIVNIPTKKNSQNWNQFIANFKTQNFESRFDSQISELRTRIFVFNLKT